MKNLNLIKRLWTDSHEKHKMGGMRRYAAMLTMLLTLGVGQMWAEGGIEAKKKQAHEQSNTTYIITPNISTQDTLYLKHEDAKPIKQTWWNIHSSEIVQLVIAMLLGGGVALLTTELNNKYELKREEQRISKELKLQQQLYVMTEGVKREHQLYEALLDIQNAKTLAEMSQLTDAFAIQLDKAQLDIRESLYWTANNMHAYYSKLAVGTIEKDPVREQQYFDQYRNIFNNA